MLFHLLHYTAHCSAQQLHLWCCVEYLLVFTHLLYCQADCIVLNPRGVLLSATLVEYLLVFTHLLYCQVDCIVLRPWGVLLSATLPCVFPHLTLHITLFSTTTWLVLLCWVLAGVFPPPLLPPCLLCVETMRSIAQHNNSMQGQLIHVFFHLLQYTAYCSAQQLHLCCCVEYL